MAEGLFPHRWRFALCGMVSVTEFIANLKMWSGRVSTTCVHKLGALSLNCLKVCHCTTRFWHCWRCSCTSASTTAFFTCLVIVFRFAPGSSFITWLYGLKFFLTVDASGMPNGVSGGLLTTLGMLLYTLQHLEDGG